MKPQDSSKGKETVHSYENGSESCKNEKESESFFLRISSESEATSVAFALKLLNYISEIQERELTPLLLAESDHAAKLPYQQISSWSWDTAIEKLKTISEQKINTIIISDDMWNWDCSKETIEDDLDAFEQEVKELTMNVITTEHDKKMEKRDFANSDKWPEEQMADILSTMIDDFTAESLVLPWGGLPYFILDPSLKLSIGDEITRIAALVGFQPWTYYYRAKDRWPDTERPFRHWLEERYARKIPDFGPITLKLNF